MKSFFSFSDKSFINDEEYLNTLFLNFEKQFNFKLEEISSEIKPESVKIDSSMIKDISEFKVNILF